MTHFYEFYSLWYSLLIKITFPTHRNLWKNKYSLWAGSNLRHWMRLPKPCTFVRYILCQRIQGILMYSLHFICNIRTKILVRVFELTVNIFDLATEWKSRQWYWKEAKFARQYTIMSTEDNPFWQKSIFKFNNEFKISKRKFLRYIQEKRWWCSSRSCDVGVFIWSVRSSMYGSEDD